MKVDVSLFTEDIKAIPRIARGLESDGWTGLWTSELNHDPFLPLAHSAAATSRVDLGTAVMVAFARSPMTTAQSTWDLQRLSDGRMHLGLGSQRARPGGIGATGPDGQAGMAGTQATDQCPIRPGTHEPLGRVVRPHRRMCDGCPDVRGGGRP